MRICTYCGADIPDNARFCGICGRVPPAANSTVRYSSPIDPDKPSNTSFNAPYPVKSSTRKPYQYKPLTPEPGSQPAYQQKPGWSEVEPPNAYYPRENVRPAASWQQGSSYSAPPTPPNAPSYPAQPQPPLVLGGSNAGPRGSTPKRPRRRRGGMIGCLGALGWL